MRKISLYLARCYIWNFLAFMLIILAIIFIFDVLEILRRAEDDTTSISLIIIMALTKMPEAGQVVLPFGAFFSAMYTFWQLNKRQELVILRSSGLSTWQFLTPMILVAVLVGVLHIMIINPLGSVLLKQYETLEQDYLKRTNKLVTSLSNGVWLRQNQNGRESIIHSKRIDPNEWAFHHLTIFRFDEKSRFIERIDSPIAYLEKQGWHITEAVIHNRSQKVEKKSQYIIQTTLTPEDIQNSFASVESRSFWELPQLISQLSQTGFDTTRLRIHLHSLLSMPAFFAAMVCLAAVISLRFDQRSTGTLRMVLIGIFAGFLIFFLMNFLKALGASNQMPVLIAAWSPSFITLLAGVGILLNTEEG